MITIEPADVYAHARSHGWNPVDEGGRSWRLRYYEPDDEGEPFDLIIPKLDRGAETLSRYTLEQALNTLAAFLDIPTWQLVARLAAAKAIGAAADLVDGWHISKGGYTELAHQIRQLGEQERSA